LGEDPFVEVTISDLAVVVEELKEDGENSDGMRLGADTTVVLAGDGEGHLDKARLLAHRLPSKMFTCERICTHVALVVSRVKVSAVPARREESLDTRLLARSLQDLGSLGSGRVEAKIGLSTVLHIVVVIVPARVMMDQFDGSGCS
jgi:hypothetical protein